MEKMDGAIIPE